MLTQKPKKGEIDSGLQPRNKARKIKEQWGQGYTFGKKQIAVKSVALTLKTL